MKNIELLAPAGNLLKMKTAFAFGADAVYLGIPDFSLRVRINDFNFEKIKIATEYAHKNKKKVYVTANIFAHNRHIAKLDEYIKKLKKIKIDAFIISDPGVIQAVKRIWPKAEIHLSTQANCTNWKAAKFWHDQGISRVILGREVTLKEIKEIHKKCPTLELEYFVHGAMCMAYSGRCFLSKEFLNRSANLGDCVQPCRWEYEIKAKGHDEIFELVSEEHGTYFLNSKDLCLIEYLDDLAKAGVTSFKIEGRAKSVYYQALVSGAYKEVMSMIGKRIKNKEKIVRDIKKDLSEKTVNRGYTTGFLLGGKADQNIKDSSIKSDWEFCGQVLKNEDGKMFVKVHNSLKIGDKIEVIKPYYDIIKVKVNKMIDYYKQKEVSEAHGGGKQIVIIDIEEKVPEYSILRRKINKK